MTRSRSERSATHVSGCDHADNSYEPAAVPTIINTGGDAGSALRLHYPLWVMGVAPLWRRKKNLRNGDDLKTRLRQHEPTRNHAVALERYPESSGFGGADLGVPYSSDDSRKEL